MKNITAFSGTVEYDLYRAVYEGFGGKERVNKYGKLYTARPSKEASFAKKVLQLGVDYIEWGIWGIKNLGLNRNALNAEYNNIEKHPWKVDYFKDSDFQ
jgi:hypothetical protein